MENKHRSVATALLSPALAELKNSREETRTTLNRLKRDAASIAIELEDYDRRIKALEEALECLTYYKK